MKLLFLSACLLIITYVFAQDSTMQILKNEAIEPVPRTIPDSIQKKWLRGGLFSLNASQGSLKNWAAGGDNFSISLNLYINRHAFYKKNKNRWDNNVDINLGYINTSSLGARKNDDRFDFISKYGYSLNKQFSLSALLSTRTQFFNGYTFPDDHTRILSSTGLSPAYIVLSPGFDFHPIKQLSIFVSPITLRWVVVGSPTLSKEGAYGVDPGKHVTDEVGDFSTIVFHTDLNKILTYTGRLDLFSNYQHNPQDVDLYMTNLFTAKLGKE